MGGSELRERDKGMSKKDRRGEEQVKGEGIRGGGVTFRLSGVCFQSTCGAQSGLKASVPLLTFTARAAFSFH